MLNKKRFLIPYIPVQCLVEKKDLAFFFQWAIFLGDLYYSLIAHGAGTLYAPAGNALHLLPVTFISYASKVSWNKDSLFLEK